ncbi:MAG TPA: hypothetical protein VMA72_24930 [Streptosporangiaceae bacterium]|nr:hypothetical protein [Streptosporangiaceae bacterium]
MKRCIVACTAAAMLVAVASCSGSTSSAHSADGPATYLAKNKSEVALIQWRITTGGHVRGTLTADHIGGAAPAASVAVNSVPFTGTVHGTSVNLTFVHGLFLHNSAYGRMSGSSLTLAVPHVDGAIHTSTFTRSSNSGYDRAVAALRSSAQQENAAAAQAGSHPSANSRAVQHNTQTDLTSLYQAASLAPQAKLTNDVNRFARDAATARSRLATEKQAASSDNRYCTAASTAVGISHGVNGAALSALGDSQALTAEITAIRMDIRTAGADQRRMSRAGMPAPTSAPALIATARSSMAHAIASANSYIDQINATNTQARVVADRMATGKCSSAGQATLTPPVAHIK